MSCDFQHLLSNQQYADIIAQAVQLENPSAAEWNIVGVAYRNIRQFDKALSCFERSYDIDNNRAALFNLGLSHFDNTNYVVAKNIFEQLHNANAERNPHYCYFYAKTFSYLQDYPKALQWFLKTADLSSEYPLLQQDLAYTYFRLGEFTQSLSLFLSQDKSALSTMQLFYNYFVLKQWDLAWQMLAQIPAPKKPDINSEHWQLWQGEKNITLLVYPHEGVGDELMYTAFISFLLPLCQSIYWACDSRLLQLLTNNFPAVHFVDQNDQQALAQIQSRCDFYTNGYCLLHHLSTHLLEKKNPIIPYTRSHTTLSNQTIKIGISYYSTAEDGLTRMPEASYWQKLFNAFYSIDFFNLQENEQTLCKKRFFLFENMHLKKIPDVNLYNDFDALSNIMNSFDAIISIDNSLAHLAGRLHKPVFLLLSKGHNWRWVAGYEHILWYPTMTVLKQTQYGVWDDVFEKLHLKISAYDKNTKQTEL